MVLGYHIHYISKETKKKNIIMERKILLGLFFFLFVVSASGKSISINEYKLRIELESKC
jgi:hypothetical protein